MGEADAIVELLQGAVRLTYWVAAAICLYFAIRWPKNTTRKIALAVLVACVFAILPMQEVIERKEQEKYRTAAWEHFQKRCREDAREQIAQVIQNVEGVFLAKPRSVASQAQLRDQYWMGDPYGYSSYEGQNPAATYLYDRSGKTISDITFTPIKGYAYVELPNPDFREGGTASRYLRYRLAEVQVMNPQSKQSEKRLEPKAEAVDELKSRYAITWEDISTPDDRKYWVAGGTLTIFEIGTDRVLAKRTGFVVDTLLGNMTQGRSPWLDINRVPDAFCPPFENDIHKNKEFVAKVLKAATGGKHVQ